ncbi:hypothetical protein E2320_013735 [Naja naja]|nr:hypothetical protein E2320_013735 [Naja naja]
MFGWMGGALLCAVSGLVLLIVATATDFWMQYRYSGSLSNQGLWRFCRYADWRFSWSYILGWIAVLLTFSAGIGAL